MFRGKQELLELTKGKVKSLENVTEHQISQIQAAENEVRVTLCILHVWILNHVTALISEQFLES